MRTAREYPMTGSHLLPVETLFRCIVTPYGYEKIVLDRPLRRIWNRWLSSCVLGRRGHLLHRYLLLPSRWTPRNLGRLSRWAVALSSIASAQTRTWHYRPPR